MLPKAPEEEKAPQAGGELSHVFRSQGKGKSKGPAKGKKGSAAPAPAEDTDAQEPKVAVAWLALGLIWAGG